MDTDTATGTDTDTDADPVADTVTDTVTNIDISTADSDPVSEDTGTGNRTVGTEADTVTTEVDPDTGTATIDTVPIADEEDEDVAVTDSVNDTADTDTIETDTVMDTVVADTYISTGDEYTDTDTYPESASCHGLPNNCGPNGNLDCCASSVVEGGTFYRNNDTELPATISSFRLDNYEVSVGRFRTFLENAKGYTPPAGSGKNPGNPNDQGWDEDWNPALSFPADSASLTALLQCEVENYEGRDYFTWTETPADNERRPINCITWFEAFAFCIWDGGRLPTDAEWNYAALGGDEQRIFPWSSSDGSDPYGNYSNYYINDDHASFYNGETCLGDGIPGCTVGDLVFVGTKPKGNGRFGQSDLTGNVWEWVLDWYENYPIDCVDCSNLSPGTQRAGRGGGFLSYVRNLAMTGRSGDPPTTRHFATGVRCARGL